MDYSGFPAQAGRLFWQGPTALCLLLVLCASSCTESPSAPAPSGMRPTPTGPTDGPPDASSGCTQPALAALVEHTLEILVDGTVRQYILDAPPSVPDDPRPLVLAFHGFGDSAAGFRRGLRLYELATREAVIVVHAHGQDDVELLNTVGRGWQLGANRGSDQAFVEAVIEQIEATRCVDRRRIFATGFSNGGLFSNLLACTLGDRLAAVAAVGGAAALEDCTPTRPVPVLLLHGSADRIIDPGMVRRARNWWATRNGCQAAVTDDACVWFADCAAEVVHCEGPQAHRWPRDGLERLWRFFVSHPLP